MNGGGVGCGGGCNRGGGDIDGHVPGKGTIYASTRKTLKTQERSSDRIGRSGGTRHGYILSSAVGGLGARSIYNIGTSRARSFEYRPERRRLSETLIWRRAAAASGRRSAICAGRRGNQHHLATEKREDGKLSKINQIFELAKHVITC